MIIIKLQGGKGGGEMIGKWLKKIRENRKISQEEIANVLGIKKITYFKYESGEINIPIPKLIEIARYFETTPNYLGFDEIEFEEKKKKEEIYKERALVKDREEKMEFF